MFESSLRGANGLVDILRSGSLYSGDLLLSARPVRSSDAGLKVRDSRRIYGRDSLITRGVDEFIVDKESGRLFVLVPIWCVESDGRCPHCNVNLGHARITS